MQARLVVIMLCCATVATAQGFGRSLLTTNTTNITTTNGTIANVTKPLTPQEIQKEIQTEVCASNTIADPLKHLITNTEVSIPLYSMGLIYAFLALGLLCEVYLAEAVNCIIEQYNIPPDVAGATILAASASLPELMAATFGVFIAVENSVGTGTVVGSAVFNQLVIIGGSILYAGKIEVDMPALCRDLSFYAVAVGLLCWFFEDGMIEFHESATFVGVYLLYMIVNIKWGSIKPYLEKCMPPRRDTEADAYGSGSAVVGGHSLKQAEVDGHASSLGSPDVDIEMNAVGVEVVEADEAASPTVASPKSPKTVTIVEPAEGAAKASRSRRRGSVQYDVKPERRADGQVTPRGAMTSQELVDMLDTLPTRVRAASNLESGGTVASPGYGDSAAESGFADSEESCPCCQTALYVFTCPLSSLFRYTIPDCSDAGHPTWYPLTFIMSLGYICFVVFLMTEWASKIGCLVGMSGAFMGLTVGAIGTSIPNALLSFHVARLGFGTMAVTNAIGSNVFDILFGLGFPWALYSAIYGKGIPVNTQEIGATGVILGGCLVLLLFYSILAYCSNIAMGTKTGISFIIIYGIYIGYEFVVDKDTDVGSHST